MTNALKKGLTDWAKYQMSQDPETLDRWTEEYNGLLSALFTVHQTSDPKSRAIPEYAEYVAGRFKKNLCPYLQFIRIDALKREDYPYNIAENSVYVVIEIDLTEKSFEVFQTGAISLSRAESKATYYAAASMKRVVQANGGKWLRKSKYKDAKDFATKVTKFWEQAMKIIADQTGGYPYHQLREDATPIYATKVV